MKQLILILAPVVASACLVMGCSSHAETPKAVQHDAAEVTEKVGEKVEKAGDKMEEAGEKVKDKAEEKKEEIKKDP